MDFSTIAFIFLPIPIIFILNHLLKSSPKTKLPPGPKPWPIIGNIHLLGCKPHHSVTKLSKKYGPLITIKLGSITTVVVSSLDVAKDMFLKHDLDFSSRQHPDAVQVLDHHKYSFIWLPVGPKWRNLRKIATLQLFTNQKLDANQGLRKKKVDELLHFVRSSAEKGEAVDIAKAVSTTSLNLLSNTFFSKDFGSYDSSVSEEFKELAWHLLEEGAKPNMSDLFPVLRPLDLQGIRKRGTVYFSKMIEIYERVIDERLKDETAGAKEDILTTLLKLVKDGELTLVDVKHLLLNMFFGGTDTSSTTLEWTMAELLKHPEKVIRAQAEIDQVLGNRELRSIEESDIPNLPYIQAIIKETMRLHPALPFLMPRKTDKDVELCGYQVPKDAQVWVNIWSIGRDPTIWENPTSFMPERFLESEIDYKGRHFELMPFGSGRRICPGIPLAHRMMHLILANLLHSFNWKLDHGMNPEDVDMEEKFGIIVQKAQPLEAIPLCR